jgi:three-Cys-motif partner protein
MPRKGLKGIKWFDKELKKLKLEDYNDLLDRLSKISNVYNEFHLWTPLKLIILSYFIQPYLNIVNKLREKTSSIQILYIDPFAGSGLNAVNHSLLIGSPLVAIEGSIKAKGQFDIFFLNERDEKYFSALENRIGYLKTISKFNWINDKIILNNGDASDNLEGTIKIIDEIKYKNYLAFIDPWKWELKWNSFKKLLEIPYGDILCTLQARLIAKEIGKNKKENLSLTEQTKEIISDFFGVSEDGWKNLTSANLVREYYKGKISEYKPYIEDIKIKSRDTKSGGFAYYLIFASGREDPPWASIIEKIKHKIENFSGDIVKRSLDYIEGKGIKRIDDFLVNKKK